MFYFYFSLFEHILTDQGLDTVFIILKYLFLIKKSFRQSGSGDSFEADWWKGSSEGRIGDTTTTMQLTSAIKSVDELILSPYDYIMFPYCYRLKQHIKGTVSQIFHLGKNL